MITNKFWAELWQPLYTLFFLILTITYANNTSLKTFTQIKYGHNTDIVRLTILCIITSFYIGFRPIVWGFFADSWGYYQTFGIYADLPLSRELIFRENTDGLFAYFAIICSRFTTATGWFVIIALIYYLTTLLASIRIFRNNAYVAMLSFFTAFSTFSYATNGIRNGMACSILLLSLSYVIYSGKKNFIKAAILALIAYYLHASTILPIICCLIALRFNNLKYASYIWLASIIGYFIIGNTLSSFFQGIGFDDRLDHYITLSEEYGLTEKTGFRIDFLIYSFMPILLAWRTVIRKNVYNKIYQTIACTYIYSNSFWILLMNAAFSNRFAYLSWFLYPFVLIYPAIKIDLWGNRQGSKLSKIVLYQCLFTVFMEFIYYGLLK